MVNILLVCTAGMSTSFLVEKMKTSANKNDIEVDIKAVPEANAKDYVGSTDIVLLGPQVKYLEGSIKELFGSVPVEVINMLDYGTMNGEKVLNFALEKIK
ncbi:PTS sugar transporter subunit IIB [Oceanivirga salmonicida]|uniref:PTS sugar transporter subunit IIB n=1 Tax=Oceanivirga salmonicida TaxID=1769291 RepID=UPI0012E2FFCC|nr:PTS sugar transporter subunit IIB [Oceanivirga salmonicida]